MMNFLNSIKRFLYFSTHFILSSILVCLVFIVLVASFYFVDLLVNSNNGKTPLFDTFVIVSPSMVPTIMINDAIIIKRVDNDQYNVGDIITFSSSDSNYRGFPITHRIVNKTVLSNGESLYTTKGDNNNLNDKMPVQTDDIYGKLLLKIPKFGYIKNFLSKPSNYFIGLLIPTLLIFIYEISRIVSVFSREKSI